MLKNGLSDGNVQNVICLGLIKVRTWLARCFCLRDLVIQIEQEMPERHMRIRLFLRRHGSSNDDGHQRCFQRAGSSFGPTLNNKCCNRNQLPRAHKALILTGTRYVCRNHDLAKSEISLLAFTQDDRSPRGVEKEARGGKINGSRCDSLHDENASGKEEGLKLVKWSSRHRHHCLHFWRSN